MDLKNIVRDRQSSTFFEKTGLVMRSGIMFYGNHEIPVEKYPHLANKKVLSVYRSKDVLKSHVNDFNGLPIVIDHPLEDDHTVWDKAVGVMIDPSFIEKDGVGYIRTLCKFFREDAYYAYKNGLKELSFGGTTIFVPVNDKWYDLEIKSLEKVNHVALVDKGRAGTMVSIQDKIKEDFMNLFKKKTKGEIIEAAIADTISNPESDVMGVVFDSLKSIEDEAQYSKIVDSITAYMGGYTGIDNKPEMKETFIKDMDTVFDALEKGENKIEVNSKKVLDSFSSKVAEMKAEKGGESKVTDSKMVKGEEEDPKKEETVLTLDSLKKGLVEEVTKNLAGVVQETVKKALTEQDKVSSVGDGVTGNVMDSTSANETIDINKLYGTNFIC